MPVTRKEFEEKRIKRISELPILRFLCTNKDKAYTIREIFETNLIDKSNDFVVLTRVGYVDIGYDKTQVNSEQYYAISEKGIENVRMIE